MGGLDNGNVEKLRQLERRMNAIEGQMASIAELKVEAGIVRERLVAIGQTLGRIERTVAEDRREIKDELDAVKGSIRGEATKRESERRDERTSSARERAGYVAVGGVILAAIISALATLLDKV